MELDLILPEDSTVCQAHDVTSSLRHKLEALPEVERVFIQVSIVNDFDLSYVYMYIYYIKIFLI